MSDSLIGRRLANFQVERPLGRGGMAQVYYGRDVKLNRPVAIKVIDARYRGQVGYAERFVREAQAIAQWRHENIVQIYYADDEEGLYYYVMEYIDGTDLDHLLAEHRDRDEFIAQSEILRIGQATASALDYAHSQGIIHRDIKPSNVLVARNGRVVLVDFGLAMDIEAGTQGEIFGSAHYIAPEQARNSAHAVPQSDLYSLGVVLYRMLTGQVPFDDPSSTTVALQHLTLPPPPPRELNPAISPQTEAVLLKALCKAPEDRYQSGQALMKALETAFRSEEESEPELTRVIPPAPPTSPSGPSAGREARSRPWVYMVVGAGAALLLILMVLLVAYAFLSGDNEADTAEARPGDEVGAAVAAETPPAEPAISPSPTPTEAATATEPPASPTEIPTPEPPTATPTQVPVLSPEPRPRVVADSLNDFAPPGAEANANWEYLWSPPDENDWRSLDYESRRYGNCWYGQDYIRICQETAHPGNGADLAWRWTSELSGPVEIQLNAHKLDLGGDGVMIEVYYADEAGGVSRLFKQKLNGRDSQGFTESFRLKEIAPGDQVNFVMRHTGNAISDHTAFQARICHYNCPR